MNMDRYFAVEMMWEDRHHQVVSDLREVWKRYREIMGIRNCYQMFPDSVDEITRHDGHYHISGTIYSRGCSDGASCKMPYSLIDSTDREDWFRNLSANLELERKTASVHAEEKQQQQERALLATLKAKYGEE